MFGDYIYMYMWIISLLSDKLRSTPFVLPNLRLYGTPVDINVNENTLQSKHFSPI